MRVRAGWLLAAVGGALAAARPFRVEVSGSSMEPTLSDGDWLLATRAGRPKFGSVVILRHPLNELDLVKRVLGGPGDVVDGKRLDPGEYLVVGDNRGASTDGRVFGTVRRNEIEGVVRLRYRPRPGLVR